MTVENTTAVETETHGVELTDAAALKAKALLDQEGRDDMHLRIAVQPGGCAGLRYQLFFDDRVARRRPVPRLPRPEVGVDRMSAPYLQGAVDRLRRHHREAGLHDRQPERRRLLRLRRLVQLIVRRHAEPDAASRLGPRSDSLGRGSLRACPVG